LILDAALGRQRPVIAPGKHLDALALGPDGQSVAGAVLVRVPPRELALFTFPLATLERVQVWSVATGEEKWRASLPSNRVVSTALAFSRNGRWLAGNTTDRTVTLWDAQTGAEPLQLKALRQRADRHYAEGRAVSHSTYSERVQFAPPAVRGPGDAPLQKT
jgi:WD40 repeat protein